MYTAPHAFARFVDCALVHYTFAMLTAQATDINVPLLDLKAQYATIRDEIEPVVHEVIESKYFIGGPKIDQL